MFLFEDTREVLKRRDFAEKIDHHKILKNNLEICLLDLSIMELKGYNRTPRYYRRVLRMLRELVEFSEKELSRFEYESIENEGLDLNEFLKEKELQDGWERRARKRIWRIKSRSNWSLFERKKKRKRKNI